MKPTPIKPPTDNRLRVARGGGWYNLDAAWFRAAYRYGGTPTGRSDDLGFRCAQRSHQQILKGTP